MIRFNHDRNTWQISTYGQVWLNVPVDLVRDYFDQGYKVSLS